MKKGDSLPPTCAHCDGKTELVTGREIYPHRNDMNTRHFWRCVCGAYVGVHQGSTTALGTCANEELRRARNAAHRAFDPFWKRLRDRGDHDARRRKYGELADKLGVDRKDCHIALFNIEQCERVVELCMEAMKRHREQIIREGMEADERWRSEAGKQ